jgi:hypothetical protein
VLIFADLILLEFNLRKSAKSAFIRVLFRKRKRMGIEPTCEAFATSHNGFEDRGRHQASSHFLNTRNILTQIGVSREALAKRSADASRLTNRLAC